MSTFPTTNYPVVEIREVWAVLHASYGDIRIDRLSRIQWSGSRVTFEFPFIAQKAGTASRSTLHVGPRTATLPCAAAWGAGDTVTVVQPIDFFSLEAVE